MLLHTSRAENRAEGFAYTSMAADHETDVFRMNPQFEDNHRLPSDGSNQHSFRMVHKRLWNCL